MTRKFKRWLRDLDDTKARVFYIAVALGVILLILHNPTEGYRFTGYGGGWKIDPRHWNSRGAFDSSDLLEDVGDLSFLLKGLILIAVVGRGFFWMIDVRSHRERTSAPPKETVRVKLPEETKKASHHSDEPPDAEPGQRATSSENRHARRRSSAPGIIVQSLQAIATWWWVIFGLNMLLFVSILFQEHEDRVRRSRDGLNWLNSSTDLEKLKDAFGHSLLAGGEQLAYVVAGLVGSLAPAIGAGIIMALVSVVRRRWLTLNGWILSILLTVACGMLARLVADSIV